MPATADVHAVGLAVLHHLGVAADDRDAGLARRLAHGAHFGLQHFRGQPRFENEGHYQRFGARARYREIVDRAVDGQFADGAAGKAQRA